MSQPEPGAHVNAEITSQPDMWQQAAVLALDQAATLPQRGERIAVVGCGTSAYVAQTYAAHREASGHGLTDAFVASEFPAGRRHGSYDRIVAITRSGTTTEILDLLAQLPAQQQTLALVGDPDSPAVAAATNTVLLSFADEQSVVQTRFATSIIALLRTSLGEDLTPVIDQARSALRAELPADWRETKQFVFLGRGPGVGLAHEAALKMRESALAWAEAYPSMDYRHGPISVAEPHTLVWHLTAPPAGLVDQIAATGARNEVGTLDPLAELVRVQRTAVSLALHRGYNPDQPRHLTRSIVLDQGN